MPNQNAPAQFPGEDVLLDTLQRSKITDTQRQQMWDAYHTPGGEQEFVGAMNKSGLNDDVKQTLYDMRFKGFKNQPTTQQAPSAPKQAEPSFVGPATTMGPRTPGVMERLEQVFDPFVEHLRIGGAAQDPRLIAPEQAMTPLQQAQHPIARAVGEFAGGLTTGGSIAAMAATGGMGTMGETASKLVPRLVSGVFSASMIKGMYDRYAPFKAAMDRGDADEALYHLTHGVLSGAMATQLGQQAVAGVPAAGPTRVGYRSGLEEAPSLEGLTRENAARLQGLGYTNQHISNMNALDIDTILKNNVRAPSVGEPAKAPVSPAGMGPGPMGAQRPTEVIAPQVPKVAPTGDIRSRTWEAPPPKGPLELDEAAQRVEASKLETSLKMGLRAQRARIEPSPVTPSIVAAGLVDKGEIVKGAGVYQVEHPEAPGMTVAVSAAILADPQKLKNAVADKLTAFANNPITVPGIRVATPEKLHAIAAELRGGQPSQTAPIQFPGASGPLRPYDPTGQRFAKGSTIGMEPVDPYYKPPQGELVPASEVTPPVIQSIKPVARATSWQLPETVTNALDVMHRAKPFIDNPLTEEQRAGAQNAWNSAAGIAKSAFIEHLKTLDAGQKQQLLDHLTSEATRHTQQAQAVNDIIAGDKVSKVLRGAMATDIPGEYPSPFRPVGALHADLRSVIHEMLGDKTSMQFDETALNQRARAREQGLDPDIVQPEGYRRVSAEEYQTMRLEAKNMLQGLQDNFKNKVKSMVEDRVEKNPSLMLAQGEEAAKNIHAQVLKEILAEKNEKGQTLTEQIKDLRDLIGRDPQRPVYVKKGVPIVEAGVIKAPGIVPAKSLKVAQAIWGTKVNKIPSEKEWETKANEFQEKGRLLQALAQGIAKALDVKPPKGKEGEAGFVGEVRGLRRDVPSIVVPDIKEVIQRAKDLSINNWAITDDKPSGPRGWISPDGKHFIESTEDHDTTGWLLGDKSRGQTAQAGDGQRAFEQAGWIRKVSGYEFSVDKLTDRAINAIEMDTIRGGFHGRDLLIDSTGPRGPRAMRIDSGWEDLAPAIARERRSQGFTLEAGKVGGLAPMLGATAGSIVGGVAGAVVGGVHGAVAGAALGWSLGFATPALLHTRAVGQAMKTMAPIVRSVNMTLKNWFQGIPQIGMNGIDPDMDSVIQEQMAHADRSTTWVERAKQLPATIYRGFDPFAYVADKRNMSMIGKTLMSLDPKGRVFRDLTIPDNQSLYVALRNAGSGALGQRRYQNMSYNDIKIDANKLGQREMLDRYLNYKAYLRVNEVLQEHIQSLDSHIQDLQQKLGNPSNTIRQTIALQDDLKDAQKMRKEIDDKVRLGEATPKGYTTQKVNAGLAAMQQHLGPQKFAEVEGLAQRAFKVRDHILDMLFDNGIVSQEAYSQFKQRGPEYIPMERIMDDLEKPQFKSAPSPLHLKHQTVIQTLEGSQRTNVNPWEAFDHADRKAFNQIYRNDAMKSALDLAGAYPNTIGQEFKPVKADYQPKAGEMVIGHYENGQPQLFAVPTYLGETMRNVPLATKTSLSIFANWYMHKFKQAATIGNIGFQASSLLAHAISGAILAPHGLEVKADLPVQVANFINDWRKAAKQVFDKSQLYREMVRSGGAFGSFQAQLDPEYFASPSELGWQGKIAKGRILDAAQDLAQGLEDINRLNIFMRARQSGMSAKGAGWEAKQFAGAPDFSRLGDLSTPLNHALMFFNAANQYLHQATSAIRKDPQRVFGWMIALTALSASLSAWNMQQVDSRGNNLLRKETTFDRQRYWVVETPYTYFTKTGAEKAYALKIPKPYIARLLNPVEDVINYATGKEARTGQQQALDSISNVSPIHLNIKAGEIAKTGVQSVISDLHPLVKFGIQQYANVDDFGRPIVPGSQLGIEPGLQAGPTTSSVAQRMGEGGVRGAVAGGAMGATLGGFAGYPGMAVGGAVGAGVGAAGISPRRIDVGVRSLTAGAGAQATSLLDPFFGGLESRRHLEGIEKLRQTPGVGQIVGRFFTSPSDAEFEALSERFYSSLQQADVVKKTSDYLLAQGKGPEAAQYIQAHKPEIHQAMILSRLMEPIKMLNQRIRELQSNPQADTEPIRKALENMYEVRLRLLRSAKDLLDAVPSKSADTTPMGGSISSTVK